jgi:hypothetical protein
LFAASEGGVDPNGKNDDYFATIRNKGINNTMMKKH